MIPLDGTWTLELLPQDNDNISDSMAVDDSILNILKELWYETSSSQCNNNRILAVNPG